jgi:hypothetical protein
MVEKTHSGQPIDHLTRPQDVPEFLSCGHNAHWVVWHSIQKGEPCIFCRAEKAELAVKEMLKAIEEGDPLDETEALDARHPRIFQADIDRWKTVITGEWRKQKCKISLRTLIHIEHELRYAPEFVILRQQKHITNDQIGEVFRLAMERIEEIRVAP